MINWKVGRSWEHGKQGSEFIKETQILLRASGIPPRILPTSHLEHFACRHTQLPHGHPQCSKCLTHTPCPCRLPMHPGDGKSEPYRWYASPCRKPAQISGCRRRHTDLSDSGHCPRENTRGFQHPSQRCGIKRKHTILGIHPHPPRGNKRCGMDTSIEKVWESLRIPSWADWWMYFCTEASQ